MRVVLPPIIAAIILMTVTTVFSQSREVTESELKQLIAAAAEKRKGLSLRVKTVTSGYAETDSSETVTESGPNDSYRYIVIRKSKGVEIRTEGIRIGDVQYTRQKDGSWIKEPPPNKTGGTGSGTGSGSGSATATGTPSSPPERTIEYLFVGKEKVGGLETSHYRKIHTVKFTSRTPVLVRRFVEEYWFRQDGVLVKESKEDTIGNSKNRYISVTEYEFDSNIKITPPIPH